MLLVGRDVFIQNDKVANSHRGRSSPRKCVFVCVSVLLGAELKVFVLSYIELLCCLGWAPIYDPPASESRVLGLQLHANILHCYFLLEMIFDCVLPVRMGTSCLRHH